MPSMTFTIAPEKYAEFKGAFLLAHNVPIDTDTQMPLMTEEEWIKEWGRRQYWQAYRAGRRLARDRANPYTTDPDILE